MNNEIKENQNILDLMNKDTDKSPEIYKPTKYWIEIGSKLLTEIKKDGLQNFRGKQNSMFYSIGALDFNSLDRNLRIIHKNSLSELYPFSKKELFKRILRFFLKSKHLRKAIDLIGLYQYHLSVEQLHQLIYQFAVYYGYENNAKSLSMIETSMIGNPSTIFYVNDKVYSRSFVEYYFMYAYCSKFLDFDNIKTIMEIGSGYGGQVEVIKKLHPNLNFYLFDIPPALYVCEQYLKTIFPDSVVSYEQTRKMKTIPKSKGKIFLFPTWKIQELNPNCDLFWNSHSFQEMNIEAVNNYLKFINKQTKKHIFLNVNLREECDITHEWQEVNYETYLNGLPNFKLKNISTNPTPTRKASFLKFCLWDRI